MVNGCSPDGVLTQPDDMPTDIKQTIQGLDLKEQNKKLLIDFFSGKMIDKTTGKQIPKFRVRNIGEMLEFGSKSDVDNFFNAVDAVRDRWDYTDKHPDANSIKDNQLLNRSEDDGFFESYADLGDDVLNAIDLSLNFLSLRRHYEKLEYINASFRASLSVFVDDPEMKAIMSTKRQVKIGSTYYYQVKNGLIAQVANNNLMQLQEVEQDGFGAVGSDLSFWDEYANAEIDGLEDAPPPPPNACMLFTVPKIRRIDNDFRTIELNIKRIYIKDSIFCGVPLTVVKWGDGTQTTMLESSLNHTYDNIPPEGKNFVITIDYTPIPGICDGCLPKRETIDIRIRKLEAPCFKERKTRDTIKTFSPSVVINSTYEMESQIGQRGVLGFFASQKIWMNTKFYKKDNNSRKRFVPAIGLEVSTSGNIFTNDCETESVNQNAAKLRKDDSVEGMIKPNQNFGSRKSGNTELKGVSIARLNTAAATRAIQNIELWPEE